MIFVKNIMLSIPNIKIFVRQVKFIIFVKIIYKMAKKTESSLSQTVANSLKTSFNIDAFKKSKFLGGSVKFKSQRWIPFSKALQDALGIPGVPMGGITLLRGHSNTGKSTTLSEIAAAAQTMNVLPVWIVTEMKHDWAYPRKLGFQMEDVVNEDTGEVIDYKGFFLYVDRGSLNSIEDMASFIADLLNEQATGKLPYDLLFLIDSIGSIPCKMSIDANNNNPQWNAGAYSQQFGNFINQRITLSRKENQPYTNTIVAVNKIWVSPAETKFSQPKMRNKGGDTMFYDSSLVLTFGNITNSGVSKIKATKNKKEVEFAGRTKVSCDKNHVTGITTKSTIIMTLHGFIEDDPKAIEKYKKLHSNEWSEILGQEGEIEVVVDNSEWEEDLKAVPIISIDEG